MLYGKDPQNLGPSEYHAELNTNSAARKKEKKTRGTGDSVIYSAISGKGN